jgi:hypothetical protein
MYTKFQGFLCEGKRTVGRLRNGIKMGLKEVGWVGLDCIHLAQGRSFMGSC